MNTEIKSINSNQQDAFSQLLSDTIGFDCLQPGASYQGQWGLPQYPMENSIENPVTYSHQPIQQWINSCDSSSHEQAYQYESTRHDNNEQHSYGQYFNTQSEAPTYLNPSTNIIEWQQQQYMQTNYNHSAATATGHIYIPRANNGDQSQALFANYNEITLGDKNKSTTPFAKLLREQQQHNQIEFCRNLLKEEVMFTIQILPPDTYIYPYDYQYLDRYQRVTSIIAPTKTGTWPRPPARKRSPRKRELVPPNLQYLVDLYQPIQDNTVDSPFLDYVPLSQYQTPVQPLVLPLLAIRPNKTTSKCPAMVWSTTYQSITIHRNTPVFLPFLPTEYCKHGDFLLFHLTRGPIPFTGEPIRTCQDPCHLNKRVAGSPLYTEMGIRIEPWIAHIEQTMFNGHFIHKITDFTHGKGIYIGSPCLNTCNADRPRQPNPWYFHQDGIYHGKYVRQTIPITFKVNIKMPDPTVINNYHSVARKNSILTRSLFVEAPHVLLQLGALQQWTKKKSHKKFRG
jgi:hypothetical protein